MALAADFLHAAYLGDETVLQACLAQDAQLLHHAADSDNGCSALHFAAGLGHEAAADSR